MSSPPSHVSVPPSDAEREKLRATFTEDAELYHRARPGYPEALFDELARIAALRPGARILEIGCGTGQATLPMAVRGYRVTAVELGAEMAAVARRHLAGVGDVQVHTATFEAWPLPADPFDLVMAATAFHWIDPAARWHKAAAALTPGGSVAVFGSTHVAGGEEPFFEEVQACYERFMPGTPAGLHLTPADNVADERAMEAAATGLFEPPVCRRYRWEITYDTAGYLDLLRTYSGHRALDPENRRGLLRCVSDLIDGRYGGRVRKSYLTLLMVARRR